MTGRRVTAEPLGELSGRAEGAAGVCFQLGPLKPGTSDGTRGKALGEEPARFATPRGEKTDQGKVLRTGIVSPDHPCNITMYFYTRTTEYGRWS